MTRVVLLMSLVVVVGLFGCASHEIKPLAPQPIDAYVIRQNVNNVTIAAEPFNTREKVEKVFTIDLTEEGYVPVLSVMENQSGDNILLLRDEIELVDSGGNVLKHVPANVMVEKFEKNKMAYALLGFGIFSYMSAEEANKKMKSDWSSKEMPAEKVLIPYRRTHGVVYFELGKGLATLPNSTLNVPLRNMRTGEAHSAQLRLLEGIPVPDVGATPQE